MGKVLHASESGYFTNCIQNGTGFWSLGKAMDIYWRVRTWRAEASGTYITGGSPQPWSYSISGITSFSTQEEDLVCGNEFEGGEEGSDSVGFAFIQLFGVTKSGSRYNPINNILLLRGPRDTTPITITGPFLSSQTIRPETETLQSVSVFGSIGAFWIFQLPIIGQATGTFSLEPTEWWSYGGTYNTSTGARL